MNKNLKIIFASLLGIIILTILSGVIKFNLITNDVISDETKITKNPPISTNLTEAEKFNILQSLKVASKKLKNNEKIAFTITSPSRDQKLYLDEKIILKWDPKNGASDFYDNKPIVIKIFTEGKCWGGETYVKESTNDGYEEILIDSPKMISAIDFGCSKKHISIIFENEPGIIFSEPFDIYPSRVFSDWVRLSTDDFTALMPKEPRHNTNSLNRNINERNYLINIEVWESYRYGIDFFINKIKFDNPKELEDITPEDMYNFITKDPDNLMEKIYTDEIHFQGYQSLRFLNKRLDQSFGGLIIKTEDSFYVINLQLDNQMTYNDSALTYFLDNFKLSKNK